MPQPKKTCPGCGESAGLNSKVKHREDCPIMNTDELVEKVAAYIYDKICGLDCHRGGWGQTYKGDASEDDKTDYRRHARHLIPLIAEQVRGELADWLRQHQTEAKVRTADGKQWVICRLPYEEFQALKSPKEASND